MQFNKKTLQSVKVREASFSDYPGIASLESRHGLETKSYEEWSHLWIRNPVYEDLQRSWPIGWVLENENKQVVGFIGNIPLWYEFQGRKLIAAGTHAWVVDSFYRSYSLLLLERYFSQKNADLYLSTTVSPQASKAFSVFKSPPVPVGAWDQGAFWITHHRGFAASLLAMKEFPLARPLSYPLSVALLLKGLSARRILSAGRNGVEVKLCNRFDGRFDAFWEALKRKNSHLLLAVRTGDVLEWHFKYALLKNRLWILTITNASGIAAYSIFYRQDNPRFGLKRIRLVDFQALDKNMSLLLPMLLWALERCREGGIHMLECVGISPEQRGVIERLAPFQRRLPSWLYYYKASSQNLAQSLANPKVWNPSPFDGDSSL